MHRKSLLILLAALLFFSGKASAASSLDHVDPKYRKFFISAPEPDYPREAREIRLEGRGKYKALVDLETGKVTKVEVEQSTGSKLLDSAAIGALRHWRLQPHTLSEFEMPVNFLMGGYVLDELREPRRHAVYAPAPVYPYSLWRYGIHSGGRYQLTIDPNTGLVTDENRRDHACGRCDQSCLDTFRRWRFVTALRSPAWVISLSRF